MHRSDLKCIFCRENRKRSLVGKVFSARRFATPLAHNQLAEARATFFGVSPLINTMFVEPNPAPVKAALALQGLIGSELRAPMQPASAAVLERLQSVLASRSPRC